MVEIICYHPPSPQFMDCPFKLAPSEEASQLSFIYPVLLWWKTVPVWNIDITQHRKREDGISTSDPWGQKKKKQKNAFMSEINLQCNNITLQVNLKTKHKFTLFKLSFTFPKCRTDRATAASQDDGAAISKSETLNFTHVLPVAQAGIEHLNT